MSGLGKYILTALLVAVATHLAIVHAIPRLSMQAAIERVSDNGAHYNAWTQSERVTPELRADVRPSPEFAESACAYDLAAGAVIVAAPPWEQYWSLSFYDAKGEAFFVLDDREARYGAEITLVRAGRRHPEGASQVVESPSRRGVVLLRRLAPTAAHFAEAQALGMEDVCASVAALRSP
jgi:uncharacterized membrane protein